MNTSPRPFNLRDLVALDARILSFRASRDELLGLNRAHLVFGLLCTWVVGVGRYWDNSRANFVQHLGLGSVIYVFVLSLFLWLIVWPLRPRHWSYFRVVTFVSLVSPPAIIYAIPVEKFFSLESSDSINSCFLLIVALWRVALLIFFLRRLGELDPLSIIVGTFLPLTLIVIGLTELNLEKAAFSLMGGLSNRTSHDSAFALLWFLSLISMLLFIPLVICYAVMVVVSTIHARHQRAIEQSHEN